METFDAIVVGAGPAGCAAAIAMARSGLNVLVFERGKYPGAKNMWGGAFFGPQLHELFPEFWKEAPVERFVTRHVISFLSEKGSAALDFRSVRSRTAPYSGFILLRAKFDQWLAKKTEEAGAILAAGMRVDDLALRSGKIVGVRAGEEEFLSDVVVLADGVNSLLAKKAGLRGELRAADLKQGVKEVIELPRDVIEERFQLTGDEGAALEFVGSCTQGLPGGGFLYTNRESLSVGVVVGLDALAESRRKASDLLEEFKAHPDVRPLLRGGRIVEYSAHLIPVSGAGMLPALHSDGVLVAGDAAALVLGTGLILEGANFAVASGLAAAATVVAAGERRDFSAKSLETYERTLRESFVLKDLETFKGAPAFLKNPRLYGVYPDLVVEVLEKVLGNDGRPREGAFGAIKKALKRAGFMRVLSDLWRARKAL